MQNFLDFVSFGLLQLATTNRGSRPEIWHNRGRRTEMLQEERSIERMKLPDTANKGFSHRDNDVCSRQDPT